MKLSTTHTLRQLADLLQCSFIGNSDHQITGINDILRVEPGDLAYVDDPKQYAKVINSAATTILIDQQTDCPPHKALLISAAPFDDYIRLLKYFSPYVPQNETIGSNVEIHETAFLYPNTFIGKNVKIGANVILYSGVCVMDNVTIDENVIIGPNSTIGHYAFYYKTKPQGYDRVYGCGGVWIQKNVEIGALCSIDAGVSTVTVIGEGTKLDNHIHIGHDTIIGKNCLMVGQTAVAGFVTIMDNVQFWGQVGCAHDVIIGEGAVVLAQSGISKNLEGGKTYFGSPAREVKTIYKELAAIRQLPDLLQTAIKK